MNEIIEEQGVEHRSVGKSVNALIVGGLPGSLVNFRGPLLKALRARGHEVWAAANGPDPDTQAKLKEMGVEYHPVRIARAGMSPWADVMTFLGLVRLIRRVKPGLVLSYTIKPVIYGGWAARWCGVPAIFSLVTGRGIVFDGQRRLVGTLAEGLYRSSLCHSRRVFFQNPDDAQMFVERRLVDRNKTVVLNGSGVDLDHFSFTPVSTPDAAIRVLLVARLLRDKGIGEYAAAARIVKRKHPATEFHLVGPFDPNPAALTPAEVQAWEKEGLIRFHGEQSDVRPFLRACHVYVLPTYYGEGTPRTVLEAMATGRAIITTDAPGCRETVCLEKTEQRNGPLQTGKNGILVPVKNVDALVSAMDYFIQDRGRIAAMGGESRRYVEERYDVHKVNEVMLREMGL